MGLELTAHEGSVQEDLGSPGRSVRTARPPARPSATLKSPYALATATAASAWCFGRLRSRLA
jgi:hypothetical protein